MSVIKVLRDLNGLFNYSTDENPTSQQDYQKAVKNWVKTIVSLVDSNLWQPETEYTVGSQLLTPSLPYYVLRCTVAGTSGAAEPDYTDVALDDEITDGTVTWVVDGYLPLSGGTINGDLSFTGGSRKINFSSGFQINAGDGTTQRRMIGKPDGTLTWDGQPLLPVGVVQAFAGTTIPTGWLLCDGSAVSRTDYAALYAIIRTTYGAGNGSTTFNLPNLVNRMVVGSGSSYVIATTGGEASHKLTEAELPALSGEAGRYVRWDGHQVASGILKQSYNGESKFPSYSEEGAVDSVVKIAFGGNQPHNNMPPYLALRYIIKY